MVLARVVFPQPDSPTRPTISPRLTPKDTSPTACTSAFSRKGRKPRTGKCTDTFLRVMISVTALPPYSQRMEAPHLPVPPHRFESRHLPAAAFSCVFTPGVEIAAAGLVHRRRHRAGDLGELLLLIGQSRHRRHQPDGVGVVGIGEKLFHRRLFHALPRVP